MIFPNLLCIMYSAVDPGREILGDAYECLEDEQNVGGEAQDGMRRLEMGAVVVELVDFNGDEPGDQGQHGNIVESRVR